MLSLNNSVIQDRLFAHAFVEDFARNVPETAAIAFEGQTLTYDMLNRRANKLAHYLRSGGVGPDVLVGIYLERSIELVVAVLGVWKAGGAYLPMDPAYPSDRIDYMLADSNVRHLLTIEALQSEVDHSAVNVIRLDSDWEVIADCSETDPSITLTQENLAYVIYTSGSTGRPKGVLVPHRGLPNVAAVQQEMFGLRPSDRVIQLASFSFDASVFEIVKALCSGASLYLGRQEALMPGPELVELLREQRISVMTITPSALAACPTAELPDLRVINVAGEACSAALVEQWRDGRSFFNLYGPTEATIWTTVMRCEADRQAPPIGQSLTNTHVHLLDEKLEAVAPGEAGEIFIGGVGVTRGYLGRPTLTADRFVPNPFSDQAGERLYRTGDLARRRPDGNLDYLGRVDRQVKLRGFRIELGEIETLLERHPLVQQAAVLIREDEPGEKRMVAYLVPNTDVEPTIVEMRTYVQSKLPHYMIPGAFVFLPAFPRTPNGKLDLKAMPRPGTLRPDISTPYAAPETTLQQELAPIWADVLGIDRVGINDNFFELGGHSLGLTQVIARVREIFHIELQLTAVFENPTIASFASHMAQAKESAQKELPPLKAVPRNGPLPLSFSQERIWFIKELAPENLAYNAQSTIQFKGHLDIPVLEKALTELIRRHEMLRTSFQPVDGRLMQVFHDPWQAEVPVIDLTHVLEEERQTAIQQHIHEAVKIVFNTTEIPLIRWTLLKLAEDDHLFIQVEHHFIHDGWSFAVIVRELKALYAAYVQGQPSPLPEPAVQFADFAVWQREWLQGETLDAQLDYWKETLSGELPTLELPTDHPFPPVPTFKGAAVRTEFDTDMYEALRAFSRREGVTLFITLLSAFNALLSRYSGQEDIIIGTSVANRRLQESENLIGMIVNNLVLRTNLEENPTFREIMKRAHRVAVGAYDHQDVPFERLVNAVQPGRDLSRNPLFQVVINFHDAPVPQIEMPGVVGQVEYHQNDSAKFDLNVLVIPRAEQGMGRANAENRLTMIWEYNRDIFEPETVAKMSDRFLAFLNAVMADPDLRLSSLPLLADKERRKVVLEWNETERPHTLTGSVIAQIEAQAAKRPHAPALVAPDAELSFEQLNQQANQLAHYLRRKGVGPESVVGLCLPRSPQLIITALAVLKAGGAYVPVDPTYPPERLAFLVEDSGMPLLLTNDALSRELPEMAARVVNLNQLADNIAWESVDNLPQTAVPQNLAYVIYTSGSTGLPKGVQIGHDQLNNLVNWHVREFDLTVKDAATWLAGVSFDASVWEIWPALAAGAALHIPPEALRADPTRLRDWVVNKAITISFMPTPLAEAILDLAWPESSTLRVLNTGGDALRRFAPADLPFTLVNNYGPTENTVVTTSIPVGSETEALTLPTIGRPIDNVQVYVLDKYLQPMPVGVPGELCIGGSSLARAYQHRAGLTAEKFIPNPFHAAPGQRLYRTGDLVRFLADGQIEFMGRIDEQVKIRGFRIELGEIETIIAGYPGVQETVVIVHEDAASTKHLTAYLVHDDGLDADALRAAMRGKLPDYMIPVRFVSLDSIPVTPNGKIDRRALPVPDLTDGAEREFVAPETDAELLVADIWGEVLGIEKIGIHDNFFNMGGHSLLAAQALSKIRNALEIDLSIREFFNNPTIAEFAVLIEAIILAELDEMDEVAYA